MDHHRGAGALASTTSTARHTAFAVVATSARAIEGGRRVGEVISLPLWKRTALAQDDGIPPAVEGVMVYGSAGVGIGA